MKASQSLMCFLGIFWCCSISCQKAENEVITLNKSETVTLNLNQGQQKSINFTDSTGRPRSVSIQFSAIKEGRCPQESCSLCYGGYALVTLLVRSEMVRDSIELIRASCIINNITPPNPLLDVQKVQGLSIGLSNLSDLHNNKVVKNYSVKLLIDKL